MSNIDTKMIYTYFITVTIAISVINYFVIYELNNKINNSKIYYDRLCTLEQNLLFLEDKHESWKQDAWIEYKALFMDGKMIKIEKINE